MYSKKGTSEVNNSNNKICKRELYTKKTYWDLRKLIYVVQTSKMVNVF